MRRIKRYKDGRFYDTMQKKMIAKTRLVELVKSGEEISVIDNHTGAVITSAVISELFPETSNRTGEAPDTMALLSMGHSLLVRYGSKVLSDWRQRFASTEDEIDKLVKLMARGEEPAESEVDRLKRDIKVYAQGVKGWIGSAVNKRITGALSIMNLANRGQVIDLTHEIERLSHKLETLGRLRSKNK